MSRSKFKTLAAIVVCCLGLGLTAGLMGVGLTPQAQAYEAIAVNNPRIGDYERAQIELEEHLQQRLQLHLARALKQAEQ